MCIVSCSGLFSGLVTSWKASVVAAICPSPSYLLSLIQADVAVTQDGKMQLSKHCTESYCLASLLLLHVLMDEQYAVGVVHKLKKIFDY
eukprot:c17378_g3_i1 orf=317-583(-)